MSEKYQEVPPQIQIEGEPTKSQIDGEPIQPPTNRATIEQLEQWLKEVGFRDAEWSERYIRPPIVRLMSYLRQMLMLATDVCEKNRDPSQMFDENRTR